MKCFRLVPSRRLGRPLVAGLVALLSLGLVLQGSAQEGTTEKNIGKEVAGEGARWKARQLVLEDTPAGANVIAIEYKLLAREEGADGEFEWNPVDPRMHVFQVGDACRLEVKPMTDVYLYVVTEDPAGNRTVLFPREGEQPPKVTAGERVILPTEKRHFGFRKPVGDEKVAVIATQQRVTKLDGLIKKAFAPANNGNGGAPGIGTLEMKSKGDSFDLAESEVDGHESLKTTQLADIFDAPDPVDGSSFQARRQPGNPELVLSIALRSRERSSR